MGDGRWEVGGGRWEVVYGIWEVALRFGIWNLGFVWDLVVFGFWNSFDIWILEFGFLFIRGP